ncbi:MAG: trimethylamine methyltransferase family protein [Candidatus Thorarchaeota archaeon]
MTRISFLSNSDIDAIHSASLEILNRVGVEIRNPVARDIFKKAGCEVDASRVKMHSELIEECIRRTPNSFDLYSTDGKTSFPIGEDHVLYNPGSSVSYFRDRLTEKMRKGTARDLVEIVHLVDLLEHIHAQSTALIPSDVPEIITDVYRLYLILRDSRKPIITGAFRKEGIQDMKMLLEVVVGDEEELERRPPAIFDCCPSSPLMWGDTTSQNLMDCAESKIPIEIVPAPLMGATSPVTIRGTIIQTNVEIISGIALAQLVSPGTPIIYGGAPASFDMRYATPRFAAIEAIIAACASAEVGKRLGLPTHAYLGLSDSKTLDSQAGFESGLGIALGALTRVNIISGPGAYAYINCLSLEKLVIDNELCGAAYRLIREDYSTETKDLISLIETVGPGGDFLKQKHTARNLRTEHYMPSSIIDRLSTDSWIGAGSKNIMDRARERVTELLDRQSSQQLDKDTSQRLDRVLFEILKSNNISKNQIPI